MISFETVSTKEFTLTGVCSRIRSGQNTLTQQGSTKLNMRTHNSQGFINMQGIDSRRLSENS
jgi:hypothetical protein